MKKIVKLILLISVAFTCIFVIRDTKKVDAATTIKAGKWYRVEINSKKREIQYNYKVPSSGYIYYEVVPEKVYCKNDEDSYEWWEEKFNKDFLYISTGLGEKAEDFRNFRGDLFVDHVWKKYKSKKYSIKPKKNVVFFFNFDKKDWQPCKMQFKFRVTYKKVKNFEKESNDRLEKANILKKGKEYVGVVGTLHDYEDWFTFKSPKTKKYKIKIKLTENVNKETLGARILRNKAYIGYKSTNKKNKWKTVFSRKIKKGQTVSVSLDSGDNAMYKIKAQ